MIDIASFGWPQWIYLTMVLISTIVVAKYHNDKVIINAPVQIASKFFVVGVLIWGGFFG